MRRLAAEHDGAGPDLCAMLLKATGHAVLSGEDIRDAHWDLQKGDLWEKAVARPGCRRSLRPGHNGPLLHMPACIALRPRRELRGRLACLRGPACRPGVLGPSRSVPSAVTSLASLAALLALAPVALPLSVRAVALPSWLFGCALAGLVAARPVVH